MPGGINIFPMALIKSYKGLSPRWGKECYFSENATLVGDVTLGDQCSVWFNAVVRGDVAPITIGDRTNVQDGSCIHVTYDTGPTRIGSDVTIGHTGVEESEQTTIGILHLTNVMAFVAFGIGVEQFRT